MKLSELCVRRPIATILLWACAVAAGVYGWATLPVSALPRYETPTIEVKARLSGASPATMASSVAAPLEKEFSAIEGLVASSSQSIQGESAVLLEFDGSRDIDAAAGDVQAALFRVSRKLPAEMTATPDYKKVNPGDAPILKLALRSPVLSLADLNAYIDELVVPAISQVNGVAQVNPKGHKRHAVRVQVDPERLAAMELTLSDVASAVRRANSNTAMGQLDNARQMMALEIRDSLMRARDFRGIVVASRDGRQVVLSDVASVEDGVEETYNESRVNGELAIVLDVKRQPGANIAETVGAIGRMLPALQAQLPESVSVDVMGDRSESVRSAIHDVNWTLALTVGLVVMVIAIFLRRASATVVPSIAIVVSLLATFAGMAVLGLSLNNVSLMGLTIAVGLVVDDAIVVLENIHRHVEKGLGIVEASIRGAREVGFTLLSISLSLVVVFVPILLMPGTIGLLFREFAIVVSLAVLVSMLVGLTLIPALAPRVLGEDPRAREAAGEGRAPDFLDRLRDRYARMLDVALRHRALVLAAGVACLVLTGLLYATSSKGFFPQEDTGQLVVSVRTDKDMSYHGALEIANEVYRRMEGHEALHKVVSKVDHKGIKFEIDLVSSRTRPSAERIIAQLRKRIGRIPGVAVTINPVQNLKVGSSASSSPFEYILRSVGTEAPYDWAVRMQQRLMDSGVFSQIDSDAEAGALQAEIAVDREKMSNLGIDMATFRETLSYAFGGREVTTIFSPQSSHKVILEVAEGQRQDENDLARIQLRGHDGVMVPFGTIASIVRAPGQSMIAHRAQLPAVTLSFDLADGYSLSDARLAIEQAERDVGLPTTVFGSFGGQAALFEQSQRSQLWLILVAIAAIYVILGVLYESWVHPLTILVGIPAASMGALLALRVTGLEVTFVAMVGVLLLIGVVKKNAILLVDFALSAQARGASAERAVRDACMSRFRPIMMTSVCTLMGALPLALGLGAGAEMRQPMGVAVVGGLALSLAITLFLTPVVYLYFDALSQARRGPAVAAVA